MKHRTGGLAQLEQRVLDGDPRALRALVRQAQGPNTLDLPFRGVELREAPTGAGDGARLLFTGYASVTETPYTMTDWLGDYTEVVRGGSFTRTLNASPDVIFVPNHAWDLIPMARTRPGTCRLAEDSTGLHVEADLDATRADVHQLRSALDAGELDAMSFAFWVCRQSWSPDYEQRDILEVDLDGGDVSVVTWPANPATAGTTALRSRQARALLSTRVPALIVARARAEKREGKTLSAATTESLQAILDLVTSADVAIDSAQELLSELLGVEPPADDDTVVDGGTDTSGEGQASSGPHPADVRARQRQLAAASR